MTFDWDDFGLDSQRDAWFRTRLTDLKAMRPDFRCTLFAVPGFRGDYFWDVVPIWIELAVHGCKHLTPMETADWTYARTMKAIAAKPRSFVAGWKSPGWQTSEGTYAAMLNAGWWVADQHNYDEKRPNGLLTYMWEDGNNWHGHVGNDCGNGLEETWDHVVELVKGAESFEFASKKVLPWPSSAS